MSNSHPGLKLAEALVAHGIGPAALAREIRVPTNRLTAILHGERGITGDTALRLGHWFETSSDFWLALQNQYDLAEARAKAGDEIAALPTRQTPPLARSRFKRPV